MTRPAMPKAIRETVLSEFNHRCAICGSDRPQIHHIDENRTNNISDNLLPLCPNCHIRDQHNPTHKMEVGKLQLFRRHKDPALLKPQFHPVFVRQQFLDSVEVGHGAVHDLERKAEELVELIGEFEMGTFYAKRLMELIGPIRRPSLMFVGEGPNPAREQERREANLEYRTKLIANRISVQALIVEQLRFQGWANEA